MTDLGPEWRPDSEGVPSRKAARLLLFDRSGRILLVRGHDTHDLNHQWWFTVGGGRARDEDPRDTALREAREETGLRIPRDALVGPVAHRAAEFHFTNVVARQDELFFAAYLDQDAPEISNAGLTLAESETLDEFRWFSLDELEAVAASEPVYPESLPALCARWRAGWDGQMVELGEEVDEKPASS